VLPDLEARLDRMAAASPSRRNLGFDDVTALAAYLASPAAAMVQVQVLTIDGGATLR
jgi:enoyl-[acyl-carrier-protein] reductase (NADH)